MDSKGPQYALSNCPELGDQLNEGTSWSREPFEWETSWIGNRLNGGPLLNLGTVTEWRSRY